MFNRGNRRSGFTLPEVLVTVAIVAVLAAMVVPAVTQQISKGDAPAFNGSISGIRTAIASFAADVRKLPGALSQLSVDIDASGANTAKDLGTTATNGTIYTETVGARWAGPYESSGSNTGVINLGMGWATVDSLVDVNGYLVASAKATGAVVTDAEALDLLIDGVVNNAAGLIRWTPDGTTPTELDPPNTIHLYLMSSAR